MNPLTKHLIVISFDCLSSLDFPTLQKLPNFQKLLEKASYCKHVETIYPSVTYPCHATIVTGKFPKRHGITNNKLLQPGRPSPDWYWHRKHIKGTTLYDEAKNKGMKTAALLWPVTARANIDYNLPEIFPNRPWHNQVAVSLWNGSPLYLLDLERRFGHLRKGLNQPELDDFVLASTVHTIKTKKPHLMLIHFVDLDSQRHYHGFDSEQAQAALQRHDERLGEIMKALKDAGIYEQSTIIALGDHSALDESKVIKLNVLLEQHGLLSLNEQGKITDWKAYCNSCDGSAYVYVKDEGDTETKLALEQLLQTLVDNKENGIETVYTRKEATEKGADPKAFLMLEALRGYYFSEHYQGDYIDTVTKEDVVQKKYTFACHGYSPEKSQYETIFIAAGNGIKPNVVIPSMHLIDEGPTFARLLGLHLGDTDGKIVEHILEL